jgi:hypothetical protein
VVDALSRRSGRYPLVGLILLRFGFDYEHTGKLDYLALYRPGTGTFWLLKKR